MLSKNRGFLDALVGDGRPLIALTGLSLALAGLFAVFQAATGQFLPQDVSFLGMAASDLCGIDECRIVHFMIHDRISFGGGLIGIGVLYLWLSEFPLRDGQAWAWWTLAASGVTGFGSFLTYLAYGYLDTWHAAATIALLPCFVGGLWRSRRLAFAQREAERADARRWAWWPSQILASARALGPGRVCLLAMASGMIGAGITIQCIAMTSVFVDTDLTFIGMSRSELKAVNPRLIPLIAHDRAGFGGATATAGLLAFACVWWGTPSRSLWQALLVAGAIGWTTAIGVHPAVGYTDFLHLAPAVTGATLFAAGLVLTRKSMFASRLDQTSWLPESGSQTVPSGNGGVPICARCR
jgi:hypothetical protein